MSSENDFDSLRSEIHPPAGTDAGLQFMQTTFPDPQFVWLRRADKVRQGISWWRAAVTDQWGLRPGQQAARDHGDRDQAELADEAALEDQGAVL